MDYSLAFEKFFGIESNKIRKKVIITNIMPVFTGLIDRSSFVGKRYCGFYDIVELELEGGNDYHVIKVTSGSNIIDVVKLLTMYVTEIIFIGIAGCLDSSYVVGDVCSPNSFIDYNEERHCCGETICQTTGLIQTEEFYLKLKNDGVVFVDMECFDIYSLCKATDTKLKYIVQISDFPLNLPFYEAKPLPINIKKIEQIIGGEKNG